MRFRWLAVVVLLGGVAMSASIEAQNKRTANLSVRVLVVRPCLVNTAPASSGSSELNCDVPGAPAPRMHTAPFQGAPAGSSAVQPQSPLPPGATPGSAAALPPAAITTLSGEGSHASPGIVDYAAVNVSPDAAPVVTATEDGALVSSPATPNPTGTPNQTERLRVLTVNF